MGIRGVSLGSLLLIMLIIVMVFGTGRLRSIGSDLGAMLKGFREGLNEGGASAGSQQGADSDTGNKKSDE
ncbi:twin-arginine translocase TatA/TatE family subunit [Legionella sp. CNM-4043-24]|uniref:twin-arginine translocase TatA/TatE family subunit n=1 Tax=Legionella sp. CNM-4043-24 TaxID=3421646 RepID=UPI00403B06DA